MSVRTSSAPGGNSHKNSGVLFAYHFVWSGWLVEVMSNAFTEVTGVSACGGGGVSSALVRVKSATSVPFKTFVP